MDVIRRERFKKENTLNSNDENENVDIWDLDQTSQFKSKKSNKSNKSKSGKSPIEGATLSRHHSLDEILEEQQHQVQIRAQRKSKEAIEKLDIQ